MPAEARLSSPRHLKPGPRDSSRAVIGWSLVAILVLAALLRLYDLAEVPPGLNHDAAVNVWNTHCLLWTGQDQFGQPWPILYFRALGENRSTLFLYLSLPFDALVGLHPWTGALPAALGGVGTVALMYWVGRRMFGPGPALAAAALLALNPTHVQLCRWGHEASLVPLLTLAPLAAWIWAGFPLAGGGLGALSRSADRSTASVETRDSSGPQPRPLRALLAGLLTGGCCYGYPAVRLYLPLFLLAGALSCWTPWRRQLHTRVGRLSVAALFVGLALTIGPLACAHLLHPDQINKRGQSSWIWQPNDSRGTALAKITGRYVDHFGLDFLFEHGDADELAWTLGLGFLPWYLLPLLIAGLIVLVPKLPHSPAARLVVLGLLLYPVPDSLNHHISAHGYASLDAQRSAGVLPVLTLFAGVGFARPIAVLARRRMYATGLALSLATVALIAPETVGFLTRYFIDRQKQVSVYTGTQADILAAARWLRPHQDDFDAVICTAYGMPSPYLIMLVGLQYDPRQWSADPHEIEPGVWDRHTRFGKFYFLFENEQDALLAQWRADGRPRRVALLLRPDERPVGTLKQRIRSPNNEIVLLIYELNL